MNASVQVKFKNKTLITISEHGIFLMLLKRDNAPIPITENCLLRYVAAIYCTKLLNKC